jgi:hypothetical protein
MLQGSFEFYACFAGKRQMQKNYIQYTTAVPPLKFKQYKFNILHRISIIFKNSYSLSPAFV